MLRKHYIPTCSVLFRSEFLPDPFPEGYEFFLMGDIPLQLIVADKGLTKYFPKKMAAYRKHDLGITSNKVQMKNGRKGYLYMYKKVREHLGIKRYLPITVLIIKTYLGKIKDILGYNPSIK